MKINKRQTIARRRISKISNAIAEAIDSICKEDNYQITYSEINAALIDVLKSNNSYELRELWDKSKNGEKEREDVA